MSKKLYTRKETAEQLSVSPRTLDGYVKKGMITPIRIASVAGSRKTIRFSDESIRGFIEYCKEKEALSIKGVEQEESQMIEPDEGIEDEEQFIE